MENKNLKQLVQEADKKTKTDDEILELMMGYYNSQATNLKKIKDHTDVYNSGGDLNPDEFGINKTIFQIAKRFCKVHASYVLKDNPNVLIQAKNPEDPASNELASKTKKHLDIWWREQSITRKLKRAVRKASYKGSMCFYLSRDAENDTYSFNTADPENCAYGRVSDDPSSQLLWFSIGEMIDINVLKLAYPAFKDKIVEFKASKFYVNQSGLGTLQYMVKEGKAFCFNFIDSKYIYTYINDTQVEKKEHNYGFIPCYVFPYFDFDSDEVVTLIDFIKDPIKMINQTFGCRLDFTQKHSDPPLVVKGNNTELDPKKIKGGVIRVQGDGDAAYIGPQASSIDAERLLEITKAFLHFLSGLSEEAMAGFTGSLTAAGVSIELRLDSTVREAIDSQIILQDVLQQINRDYLRLVEKTKANDNIFKSKILGIKSDVKFFGREIAGLYDNTVDFGGILPRSVDQLVRNTVTKFTTGLISQDTALAELNYGDPTIEKAKIRNEIINKAKLEKQIQQGVTPDEKFFASPEEENIYMFQSGKAAMVSPDQDHEYHIAVHESVINKFSDELKSLLVLHIQTHKSFIPSQVEVNAKQLKGKEPTPVGNSFQNSNERSFQ